MIRKTLSLVAPLLAVAAIAPAVSSATTLHSAPTLRHAEGGRIQLKFAVDKKFVIKKTKITVNGDRVAFLKQSGRHGKDFVYTALAAVGGLEDGHKYKVRFHFSDGDTATRLAKLH